MTKNKTDEILLYLPPQQVFQRIQDASHVVPSVIWSPTWALEDRGNGPEMICQIEDTCFFARVRHWYSNGLTSIMKVDVASHPQGSVLRTSFHLPRITKIALFFVLLLFGGSIFGCTLPCLSPENTSQMRSLEILMLCLSPLWTVGFVVVICLFALKLGHDDKKQLKQWLDGLFEADVAL